MPDRRTERFQLPAASFQQDRLVQLALLFVFPVIGALLLGQESSPADLVLLNGSIITVDPRDSIVEAVAIKDGRITFAGTTANARKLAGDRTRVIDLAGRTATPGLIDTHVHFSESADSLDLGDARSMDDVIAKVRARAATVPPGTWVRGGGWDEGKLKERRYITAADLDKAAPEHPVYLTHTTGHYGVANSLAVRMGADLQAAVPYYGGAPPAADVAKIKAAVLVQHGGEDKRLVDAYPEYEAAMKAAGVRHEGYIYPGAVHGFNNDATPQRYNKAAAEQAWQRTVAWFNKYVRATS